MKSDVPRRKNNRPYISETRAAVERESKTKPYAEVGKRKAKTCIRRSARRLDLATTRGARHKPIFEAKGETKAERKLLEIIGGDLDILLFYSLILSHSRRRRMYGIESVGKHKMK